MVARIEAVALEVGDAEDVAAFWAELLGRRPVVQRGAVLLPGDAQQVGLRFVTSDTEQVGPRRMHLHLTSTSLDDQLATVEKVLRLGGRHLDVGQDPDDEFVVLADPGGNEMCVIEPGNSFLAGTGYLGEITCEGSRQLGLFWHEALAWPLVWDHEEETAIQSPRGGTKVSWGGDPAPHNGRSRQRFDLVCDEPMAEAERLVTLGATVLAHTDEVVELADVDGNEFALRPATASP
jgi:catechol 2,3-dioxygenase-like lactoylglutathione lyase family enzyme